MNAGCAPHSPTPEALSLSHDVPLPADEGEVDSDGLAVAGQRPAVGARIGDDTVTCVETTAAVLHVGDLTVAEVVLDCEHRDALVLAP